jgi:hypothetical protein
MKLNTIFKFYKNDDAPYIGAYAVGSLTNNEPTIMFNMEVVIDVVKEEKDKVEIFKDVLLSTLTHEFCHSMQEWLDKEFDELEVEKILGAYNEKWNVFESECEEQDPMSFNVMEFLELADAISPEDDKSFEYKQGANDYKKAMLELFGPMLLWYKAEKQDREEKRN